MLQNSSYGCQNRTVVRERLSPAHLCLRNIHHAYADVRASLGDHGHRRPTYVAGTHTADVVLEILSGHDYSCVDKVSVGAQGGHADLSRGVILLLLLGGLTDDVVLLETSRNPPRVLREKN